MKLNTRDQAEGTAEQNKWKVKWIPTTLMIDSEGKEIGRYVEYAPPDEYIAILVDFRDVDVNREEGKKKIEADPEDPAGYLQLARGDAVKGNTDEAEKNFRKAAQLDPKNENGAAADAYERLANLYAKKQDFNKAVQAAKKLAALDRGNKKGLSVKAADMLSNFYHMLKDMNKAVKYARKVIRLDMKNKWNRGLQTAIQLAQYYIGQGDVKNAKKYSAHARRMDPQDEEKMADSLRLETAAIPAKKEKWGEAIEGVKKFIRWRKNSYAMPRALLLLGYYNLEAGNKEKAKENFNKVISRFPDSWEAGKAKQLLPHTR